MPFSFTGKNYLKVSHISSRFCCSMNLNRFTKVKDPGCPKMIVINFNFLHVGDVGNVNWNSVQNKAGIKIMWMKLSCLKFSKSYT